MNTRLWCITGALLYAIAPTTTQRAAEAADASAAGATQEDRVQVSMEGGTSVVNVTRVGGVGGVEVAPPKSGWPAAVMVRLHGFYELERFQARGRNGTLDCVLRKAQRARRERVCKLGQQVVDVVFFRDDNYEVTLDPLLSPDSGPIEVRWVDQWR